MKMIVLFLFVFISGVFAGNANSQETKVSISKNNKPIREILGEIERQTDYLFVYSEKEVDVNQRKTVNVSQQRVADVLSSLFRSTNVGYAMEGHNIMLMAKTTQTDAAQQKRHITGVVKDIKGETIIGANIMIKGTGTGVSTNIDGEFSIEAAAGDELIVSFIGYLTQTIKIDSQKTLNIKLLEDTKTLEEVVVVGYTVQTKSAVTGSVAVVKADKLKDVNTLEVGSMLQGKVSGVYVSGSSGEPGHASKIRIRGKGTLNSSVSPLWVVDGVIVGEDPTMFVGLTYSFIFGVMFGDVGQGLLLMIGGGLVYKFKKAPLAGIIATAGVFSTIFGFLFGSIFGFEDVLPALWIRPIDHMTTLPFLGKLNTVFIVAVAFGMFLIMVAMVLHIINAVRGKNMESAWFDPNGAAGLVFYLAVVVTVVLFMTGNPLPGGIVMAIMFGIPLLLIFFREPLTRMLQKRADKMETGKAMFVVQGFFELFETLLSYFSNTISFIRIGAFAVSHAAIMEVVLQLAGAESGSPNWAGVIFGNLFVCGFEGLIVGIQVLRLEYYELFSRFYKGSGHAFDPYAKRKTKKNSRK